MQIINRQQELELVVSNEKMIHIGMNAKMPDGIHAGHSYLHDQCRILHPDATMLLRVFSDLSAQAHIYSDFQGGAIENPPFDLPNQIEWAESVGFDYFLHCQFSHYQKWANNPRQITLAGTLPTHQLDLSEDIDAICQQADVIMSENGLDLYRDDYVVGQLRAYTRTAICGRPDFKFKAMSDKDGWLNAGRKFIFENYGNTEYIVVPALTDENGIPTGTSHGGTKVMDKNWHRKPDVLTYTPAFLQGKSFFEAEVELSSGYSIFLNHIE